MAKKKQVAFLLEKDQKEIIDELSDEEAGIVFKAIYEYETTKKEPKLDKTLKIVFKQFKVKLDSYEIAYEEKCLKNKENADKRWDKNKDATECERMQLNAMDANKIKINKIKENKINSVCVNNNVAKATEPTPTLDKIFEYGKELGVGKNYCKKFFNTYEATGWATASGVPIKNWKAKFNQWIEQDGKEEKEKPQKRYL